MMKKTTKKSTTTFNIDETLNAIADRMNTLLAETRYADINSEQCYVAIKDLHSHKICYSLYIRQSSVRICININALNYFRINFYDFCNSYMCSKKLTTNQELIVSYDNLILVVNEIERSFILYSIEKMSEKARNEYYESLNTNFIAEIEAEIKSSERKTKRLTKKEKSA